MISTRTSNGEERAGRTPWRMAFQKFLQEDELVI